MKKPFEVTRWEASQPPSSTLVERLFSKEGLTPERESLSPGVQTTERKWTQPAIILLLVGRLQVAFPGYGVVELAVGDRLDIDPEALHDLTTIGHEPAEFMIAKSL
jgi:hypothetical protein